ncbi:MAG: hypothetical protein K9H84_02500 [Bacteroidales bacterium]|nr:hypothetical protein [Bacteroidales bacterium]
MELKKFRNKYDLELIPASNENIILGTLVWDPLIGKPSFDHRGMPNHIFNAILDAGLIDKAEWQQHLDNARNTDPVKANLAETVIDVDLSVASTLGYPKLNAIDNKFGLKNISKFTFGSLIAKTMSNLMRVRTDDYLEELKKKNWDKYDGSIRRVFIITELYYGSINLVVKQQLQEEFKVALKQSGMDISNEIVLGKSTEYSFDHQDVPFAMKLERVRDFNG